MSEETIHADEDFERLKFEFFNIMQKLQKIKPHTVDPCGEMTQSEANALHAIGLYEQKCGICTARPGLIAAHMNITPSALSQILRSLEEKNLLSRSRENKDCRAVVLSLTPEGQQMFNNINARWEPRMLALIQFVGMDNLLAMTKTINSIINYDEKLHKEALDLSENSPLLSGMSADQSKANSDDARRDANSDDANSIAKSKANSDDANSIAKRDASSETNSDAKRERSGKTCI